VFFRQGNWSTQLVGYIDYIGVGYNETVFR